MSKQNEPTVEERLKAVEAQLEELKAAIHYSVYGIGVAPKDPRDSGTTE